MVAIFTQLTPMRLATKKSISLPDNQIKYIEDLAQRHYSGMFSRVVQQIIHEEMVRELDNQLPNKTKKARAATRTLNK
jgi:hypothetical protein